MHLTSQVLIATAETVPYFTPSDDAFTGGRVEGAVHTGQESHLVVRDLEVGDVHIRYRTQGPGTLVDAPLSPLTAAGLDPLAWVPVRELKRYRGQVSRPGLYWFASMGRFVDYESRLEMLALFEFDMDPRVVAVAAQPFQIEFGRSRKPKRHVPDFFLREMDGAGVVVDVKREALLDRDDVALQFELTHRVCDQVGWRYEVITEPSEVRAANLRWLAGFKSAPGCTDVVAPFLLDAARRGDVWADAVAHAAQEADVAVVLVPPVLGHLVWAGQVRVDLEAPLSMSTPLQVVGGDRDAW